MNYRLANSRDLEPVYQLYMNRNANPYLTYDLMDMESFEPIFQRLLLTKTLYVAEENGKVLGTYRLIPKTDRQQHTIYLGGFAVKDSARGKGIGKQMLVYIRDQMHQEGKLRIELTVDVDNIPAIALYEKTGFVREGRIRKSYRRSDTGQYYDDYLMALLLD